MKKPRARRKATDSQVSDHAVLRFLERVKGVDIEAIRNEILTPERKDLMRSGCTAIKCDGYMLMINNYTVITVINTKETA